MRPHPNIVDDEGGLSFFEENIKQSSALTPSSASPNEISPEELVVKLQRHLTTGDKVDGRRAALVWSRDQEPFKAASIVFNGAVKNHALVLVQPTDATDVSKTIIFCREYGLELSIKAGGSAVHGLSIAGHVILDLSLMRNISISLPDPSAPTLQESFERLHLDQTSGSSFAFEHSIPKRPCLAGSQVDSSGSPSISTKRTANEAWSDEEHELGGYASQSSGSRGKRRMDTIGETGSESTSHSNSGSSIDNDKDGDLDVSPRSNEYEYRSGNRGTLNRNRKSSSTKDTTPSPQDSPNDVHKSPSHSGLFDDRGPLNIINSPAMLPIDRFSVSASAAQPRTTYVNPSPIASSISYPFVSTNFSNAGSAPIFSTNVEHEYLRSSGVLKLNTHPDPPPYTLVTFGAGTHSKQLDAATAASQYGAFHVPTSAYPVGAGQFLSGGFGFLGRKHGLAMDNLVEAELVLADGRIVWVGEGGKFGGEWKEGEHPEEVWWAIRGAGSILGVVTRFRAKAFYVPSVYAGILIYHFDRNKTPSLLRHLRDCIKDAPRTVYANFIMTSGPSTTASIVVIQLCFSGSRSEGESYLQAINSWDGGSCMFQEFSERTFEKQQGAVEEVLRRGQGRNWFIKSGLLNSLTDEIIEQTCDRFQSVPDGCTWLFEYTGGGAVLDVTDTCFPMTHRHSAFTVAALHQWGLTADGDFDERHVTTAEDWINEVIHPSSPKGLLPCFLQSATEHAVSEVFGENYHQLVKLKAELDPYNFFRHVTWPRPDAPGDRRQIGEDGEEAIRKHGAKHGPAMRPGSPARFDKAFTTRKGKARMAGGEDIFDSLTSVDNESLDSAQTRASAPPSKIATGAPEALTDRPDKLKGVSGMVIEPALTVIQN